VDDALGMRCRQSFRNLQNQRQRWSHLHPATVALEPLRQGIPVEVIHDDVGASIGQAVKLEDVDDAWVLHDVGGSCLVEEARRHLGIPRKVGMKHLDGGSTIDELVDGLEDDAHSTFAKLAHNPVISDSLVGHKLTLWLFSWSKAAVSTHHNR
jgi:hypothetical protein